MTLRTVAAAICIAAAAACSNTGTMDNECHGIVRISIPGNSMTSRSEDPEEYLVTDMNIFIFNAEGLLEEHVYLDASDLVHSGDSYIYGTDLIIGCTYSVYACANAGYPIEATSAGDLDRYRYYLVYPDDYRAGIPMSGVTGNHVLTSDGTIPVMLERVMAKVSLCIDRSGLSDGVGFHVKKVTVGACPKSAYLFRESWAETEDDIFRAGFSKESDDIYALNTDTGFGRSGSICLYLMENMNGDLLGAGIPDDEKVLDSDDPRSRLCSYIEIEADYLSDTFFTIPGESLVYRFYLGEDNGNFDVRRNTCYNICVKPEDDGLTGDSWRIDTAGIGKFITDIRLSYDSLYLSYYGESAVITAWLYPDDASYKSLIWETDNHAVADVSDSGAVTTVGEGTCRITCTAADGSGISASCNVHVEFSPVYMKIYPGNFIRGRIGDRIHVECEYFPPDAPFDIGLEELEYDKSRGIYDYVIDEDGKGVELTLTGNGSGMLYMEAGYPVNQSEMIVIVVD